MKNKKTIKLHKQWQSFKEWQKKNAKKIKADEEIGSIGEFKEAMSQLKEGNKSLKDLKWELTHETDYKTFKAMKEYYAEQYNKTLTGKKANMSTREFADIIKNDIYAYREQIFQQAKIDGASDSEARRNSNLAVSAYFFGS